MIAKYITYRELNKDGILCYYILQKEFPNITAVISYVPIENVLAQPALISNYNMFVNFCGTISGRFVPSHKGIADEIQAVINDMSLWYYENRIIPDEKRFRKWKINSKSTH